MITPLVKKQILKNVFGNLSPEYFDYIYNNVEIRSVGKTNTEVYIEASETIFKIIESQTFEIKVETRKELGKHISSFYLNDVLLPDDLNELKSKDTLEKIDIETLLQEKTSETTSENDSYNELFLENPNLPKDKKITLSFYNNETKKEINKKINTDIFLDKINFLEKKQITKKVKKILKKGYTPVDVHTKEIIKLLDLN